MKIVSNNSTKDRKLLSIAIPTYNRYSTLRKTVENFIQQIQQNNLSHLVEIIISDNNSPDNTPIYLKDIATKFDFIVVNFNNKNLGGGINIKKSMSLSSAEFIWLCGDDDIYSDDIVLRLVNVLNYNTIDFCLINYSSNPEGIALQINKDKSFDSLATFLAFSDVACGFISCCVFKKNIIDKLHCKSLHWPHYDYLFNYPHHSCFYCIAKPSVEVFRPTEDNWWSDDKNVLLIFHDLVMTIIDSQLDKDTKIYFVKRYKQSYKRSVLKCFKKGLLDIDDRVLFKDWLIRGGGILQYNTRQAFFCWAYQQFLYINFTIKLKGE